MKKITALLAGLMLAAVSVWAASIVYSEKLIDEPALSYAQNYDLDLKTAGKNHISIDSVAAQVVYSSATVAAVAFTDGKVSTGSFTVSSVANVLGAYATNSITVGSTSTLKTSYFVLNGRKFSNGYSWKTKATTLLTAADIATLAGKITDLGAVASSTNVVTLTAETKGTAANAWTLTKYGAGLSVGAAKFSGGLAPAALTINGVTLTMGVDVSTTTVDTTSGTANAFVTAINANTSLAALMTAALSGSDIVLTSKQVGVNAYTTTSNIAGITAAHAAMTGGTASAYTRGLPTIYSVSHGLETGFQVKYTTATFDIGGLTHGVTYFAIKVDADNFQLATTSTGAVAGGYIVLTSSSIAGPHTFTLTPVSIAGTFGLEWQWSDDNENWTTITSSNGVTISSVTFATPYTASSSMWDFGNINHRYLRAKTAVGTAGGMNLSVTVTGKNSN
jgi:hypothetical protein